ncbi:MAG: DUF1189 family protein [Gammaproteobacteria bacterium]
MRQFSILQPFFYAFYYGSLYRDVYQHWRFWFTTGYLCLLVAICAIFSLQGQIDDKKQIVQRIGGTIIKQMPVVTIAEGEMSIDREMPYIIYLQDNEQPLVVFDTTDSYKLVASENPYVIIGAKEVYFVNKGQTKQKVFDLSSLSDMTIDRSYVQQWIETMQRRLPYILFPFVLLQDLVFRFAQALIHGFFALILGRVTKVTLSYKQGFCLAVVSMTPMMIMNALLDWLGMEFTRQGLLYIAIGFSYLAYAVYVNKIRS